jgi:Holliday junction resolvase
MWLNKPILRELKQGGFAAFRVPGVGEPARREVPHLLVKCSGPFLSFSLAR